MKSIALFDFDGTLIEGDSFTRFISYFVSKKRFLFGRVFLTPFVLAYKAGFLKSSKMRTIVVWAGYFGANEAEIKKRGRDYAGEVIPLFPKGKAYEKFLWHKERGDKIVIVSASLDIYLAPWCENNKVDLICSTVEYRAGRVFGLDKNGDCSCEKKSQRVKENYNLSDYDSVYAYGDTHEDDELLALADYPMFVGKNDP